MSRKRVVEPRSGLPAQVWERLGTPWLLGAAALLVFVPLLLAHRYGRLDVETDFFGEYAPYARRFLAGEIPEHFPYRGPGYHLLVAALGLVVPDLFLAGKILSALAAACLVALTATLARRLRGPRAALAAGLLCLVQPVLLVSGWSVGNDVVFAALATGAVVALHAALRPPSDSPVERAPAEYRPLVVAGLATGVALLTRPNGIFLPVIGAVWLLVFDGVRTRTRRLGRVAAFLLSAAAPVLLWLAVYQNAHGHLPRAAGYRNVLAILHAKEVELSADVYRATTEAGVGSFGELLARHGGALAVAALQNVPAYLVRNANEAHGWPVTLLAVLGVGFLAWRRESSSRDLLPFGAAALAFSVLLFSLYEPRFAAVLLPPAALAAALALVGPGGGWRAWPGVSAALAGRIGGAGFLAALIASLLLALPVVRMAREAEFIASGEFAAGAFLAGRSAPPGAVAARKPHAAWRAGRDYRGVPVGALEDLPDSLRARGVAYLQYGPAEMEFLPQYAGLYSPHGIPRGLSLVWLQPGPPCRALYLVLPPGDARPAVPPSLAGPLDELGLVFVRSGLRDRVVRRHATDSFARAQNLLRGARPAEALVELRRTVELVPQLPEVRYLLGVAALESGSWREALDALVRAESLGVQVPELDFGVAQAALGVGELALCDERLTRFLAGHPGHASGLYIQARLRQAEGRTADALRLAAAARAAGYADRPRLDALDAELGRVAGDPR